METDKQYMKRALELAAKGTGYTSPNPMVGCVIVKNGKIIGEGFHERYGELHAERNALKNCTEDPSDATMYVNLEPCCHFGRTPPCTEAVIEHQIARVVVGAADENPLVGGKGISILKKHGIAVSLGVLEKECRQLNEAFFHYIKEKTPFAAMKYAMTLDGNISTASGDSKWVTGEKARTHVHELRKQYSGIIVGIQTVIADDPMLNCRIEHGVDPYRIICDTNLRIPLDSKLVKTAKEIPTIVGYCEDKENKLRLLESMGVKPVKCPYLNGVDLRYLMKYAADAQNISSILCEGGSLLNAAMLKTGLVQKVYAYIAPKLTGGNGKPPISDIGISFMREAYTLQNMKIKKLGEDYLFEGYLERRQ